MSIAPVLLVEEVTRHFGMGPKRIDVLRGVSLILDEGSRCAIVGPSGSGKTTLLGVCAGLEKPSSGRVALLGQDLQQMTEDQRSILRNERVGFVFQSFHLMPTLTALENVMLPAEMLGRRDRSAAERLLLRVGLGDRMNHYPSQLSGGEQQRVGLARAFVNRPAILFADEPTGNLDQETGKRIADELFALNATEGTTLVLITHDLALAERVDRVYRLDQGRLSPLDSRSTTGGLRTARA